MSIERDAKTGFGYGVSGGVVMWLIATILMAFTDDQVASRLGLSRWTLFLTYTSAGALGGTFVGALQRYLHRPWVRFPVMTIGSLLVVAAIAVPLGHPPWSWNRTAVKIFVGLACFYGFVTSRMYGRS